MGLCTKKSGRQPPIQNIRENPLSPGFDSVLGETERESERDAGREDGNGEELATRKYVIYVMYDLTSAQEGICHRLELDLKTFFLGH